MILVTVVRKFSVHGHLVSNAIPTVDGIVGLLHALSRFC
jgi:hypothetical protein